MRQLRVQRGLLPIPILFSRPLVSQVRRGLRAQQLVQEVSADVAHGRARRRDGLQLQQRLLQLADLLPGHRQGLHQLLVVSGPVDVGGGVAAYLAGPLPELEGGDGLRHMLLGCGHCEHHQGLGIAPQRVLQQPGELGVPVGHVSCPGRGVLGAQGSDDVAQRTQGLVDVAGFGEPHPAGRRLAHRLAACQIHQMELAGETLLALHHAQTHQATQVTPAGHRIHIMRPHYSPLHSQCDPFVEGFRLRHHDFCEPLNPHHSIRLLSNTQLTAVR
mmetsp:Transcript_11118/g.15312  ORF Transcript_11118/g.15312 Transcript_11118/m.15312 type:complete len:273 (-) Transcript_11118:522-1340(-)